MQKGFRHIITLYCSLFTMAAICSAAPLPPFTPVDVMGKITEIRWIEAQHIKGISGMSGTAGHNRDVPAHFIVKLTEYSGVSKETAREMTRYIDWHALKEEGEKSRPSFILLQINHENRTVLQEGMSIMVNGYTVKGDEGGTWTSLEKLDILP
ncbi:MAG: hypothetical protein KJ630_03255 [Proteobacteria bacterium]|nr:hypothetical protein [Pseudomonadota bacterium]